MADQSETEQLLARAEAGDEEAVGLLFARHRDRLLRMVRIRLDRRLHGRIGASDVIQDTHLEAIQRLDEFMKQKKMPFFLWLRFLTGQKIIQLHRHHLGAQRRDARQEVRIYGGPLPEATSVALAHQLLGKHTGPSQAAMRAERKLKLEDALNSMDPTDREVLSKRHFEQLSNAEAAAELGIQEAAASKRYIRAMGRLRELLAQMGVDPSEPPG